ncbi:MAG: MarR family transcriptional regulator [Chakrabartia sp.]
MREIKKILDIESHLRLRLFTCEAEILAFLASGSDKTILTLCEMSKFSHTTIFNTLKRMVEMGVLIKSRPGEEGRRATYSIAPEYAPLLRDLLA